MPAVLRVRSGPDGPVAPTDEGAYGVDSRGRWVELGRGVVDFPAVTQVLRSVGYDGWLVNDFDFTGYDARASVKACKDYINLGLGHLDRTRHSAGTGSPEEQL